MKVNLIKPENQVIGYEMFPENEDEKRTLGSIRKMQFYGMGEDALAYNGISTEDNYVTRISWVIKKHQDL